MTTRPAPSTAEPVAVEEVLSVAANVIDDRGWHRGDYVDYDMAVELGIDNAPVCAVGAIRVAVGGDPADHQVTHPAITAFANWVIVDRDPAEGAGEDDPIQVITDWNDASGRTADEVIEALRAAASWRLTRRRSSGRAVSGQSVKETE
jgi:hypothetical protein